MTRNTVDGERERERGIQGLRGHCEGVGFPLVGPLGEARKKYDPMC